MLNEQAAVNRERVCNDVDQGRRSSKRRDQRRVRAAERARLEAQRRHDEASRRKIVTFQSSDLRARSRANTPDVTAASRSRDGWGLRAVFAR